VPGSPLDPRSAGANSLIKQGAILTESVADVTDNLRRPDVPMLHEPDAGGFSAAPPSVSEQVTREVQEALLRALGPEAVAAELLAEQLKAPPAVLQLAMLELELAGRIRRHFGGRISLNII
jgi:DNA processing protein